MGGMRKFLLAFRMVAEGIVGLFVLLTIPISLMKALTARAGVAYLLGELGGMILMLLLGVWLVKDAVRVGGRLRSHTSPPLA